MSIAVAILETHGEIQREEFMELLKRKAVQLQKIETELDGDIMNRPEPEVKKLYARQHIISEELNTMYGFLKTFDALKEVYEIETEKATAGAFDALLQNEWLKTALQTAYLYVEATEHKQFHISQPPQNEKAA